MHSSFHFRLMDSITNKKQPHQSSVPSFLFRQEWNADLKGELQQAQARADSAIKQAEVLRHDICVSAIEAMCDLAWSHLNARKSATQEKEKSWLLAAIDLANKAADVAYAAALQFELEEAVKIKKYTKGYTDKQTGISPKVRAAAKDAFSKAEKYIRNEPPSDENKDKNYEEVISNLKNYRVAFEKEKPFFDLRVTGYKKDHSWYWIGAISLLLAFLIKLF